MFDEYTTLPTSLNNDKFAFLQGGQRFILESRCTSPAVNDFVHIYAANEAWEKGAQIAQSTFQTGDMYLPVNFYNDDQDIIPAVLPTKLLWAGSHYNNSALNGYVGTFNIYSQQFEAAVVPTIKNWGWVNFIGYRHEDGYLYMTGFPNGNLIARCWPENITNINAWEWSNLPTFPYGQHTYPALNFYQGQIYMYRQDSIGNLSWDIVRGSFETGWQIIQTYKSTVNHPYWDWWANMATDEEYLYGMFLDKPGTDYMWNLKKSTDGINWQTIVVERMMPLTPANIQFGQEPCGFVTVCGKNPTYLAMGNNTTNGTMHFYDSWGNRVGDGGWIPGALLGFLRDVQPQLDGYHSHLVGVFSHQYSSTPENGLPYCSALTRVLIDSVLTRTDVLVDLSSFNINAASLALENVSVWGVLIDLVTGFIYTPAQADEQSFQMHVHTPVKHNEVNFWIAKDNIYGLEPFTLVNDWIHEAIGNVFDCAEALGNPNLIVFPQEFYHPPNGDLVDFIMHPYLPVAWNEVNWGWVQNALTSIGLTSLNLTTYSILLAAGVTIDLGLDAIEELLKEIQVKTAHMVNAAAEATGIGSAELDAFLKVILETDARGIGTSTLENVVVVIAPIKIYAEGTGIGSGSLMSYLVLLQGAEGIGIGSGSLTPYAVIIPHAEGLGISSAEVQSLLRVIAGASGVGIGTGEVPCEWAIGYGIGSGSLNALVIVLASALGEGIGSGQTSTLLAALVDAIGVGIGTGEATQYLDISAMAAGLGIGTGESLGWHVGIILAEALGEGMGLAYVLTLKGRHTVRMSCTEEHRVGMTLALRED